MTSSPTLSPVKTASRSPRTRRVGRRAAAARLRGLGLGLGLLTLVAAAGCGVVGKGPDPDPGLDLSGVTDLATSSSLCSPVNCAGCCLGDVCQPGVTTAACGGSGAVCVQCVSAQKCGANLVCAYDPNAMWLVASVQATFMTTNPLNSGKPWRTDGSMPQPLVQYDASNRINPSAIVVTGSGAATVWTVTWGMGFNYAAKDLLTTGFDLQVLDQLTPTTTQPMSNKHHVPLSQQDFTNRNLTYTGWEGVKSISITLQ